MTLALKLDAARMRRLENPAAVRPRLHIVPKVETAPVIVDAPQPEPSIVEDLMAVAPLPGIFCRICTAGNNLFAFTFILVALVSLCIGSYVAGWNERIIMDVRSEVEILMAAPLDPVQKPADWDRITGQRQ